VPRAGSLKPSKQAEERRQQLVEICSALPEAVVERAGATHLSFRVRKKVFAYYLFDHHGDGVISLCCKAGPGEQGRLVEEDPRRFFVPAYLGPSGWVGVRLDRGRVNWNEIAYFVQSSYRLTAPKTLAARITA
jgi:phosphoribosylglycinamide formyltransferase-1